MPRLLLAVALALAWPSPGRAQSNEDVKGFKDKGAALREKREARAAEERKAVQRPEKARDGLATLHEAGIELSFLADNGYSKETILDLAEAVKIAGVAVKKLHGDNPSAVGDAYGNGTMTNIEDSFKYFGKGNLQRGCLSHQAKTLAALRDKKGRALEARKLKIGLVMEHHAVVVYPKGTDWNRTGVVLDGWPYQSHEPKKMVFTIDAWKSKFFALRYLSVNPILFDTDPRLED